MVSSMGIKHWEVSDCKELKVSQNHYVIDPDRAEDGRVASVSANAIIAPSPDKGHLGEFAKTLQLVKLYIAPPTLEETLVYAELGVAGARTEELFQEFMDHRKQRLSANSRQEPCEDLLRIWRAGRKQVRKAVEPTVSNRPLRDGP